MSDDQETKVILDASRDKSRLIFELTADQLKNIENAGDERFEIMKKIIEEQLSCLCGPYYESGGKPCMSLVNG